jgi:hypothetical protein
MNDENTKRVIDACPSLFETIEDEQRKMANGEMFFPIAFYFECGDGWADLLVELCQNIQAHLNTLPKDVASEIVALQVKEKFGTLRFYISHYDETLQSLIEAAAKKSAVTCEQCGKTGRVRGSVWYYAACDEHTLEQDRDVSEAP